MIRLVLAAVFALGLGQHDADAQLTDKLTLPIPPAWKLAWKATNDVEIAGWKLTLDGVDKDLGAVPKDVVTGFYAIPFPALTLGNHILVIRPYNGSGVALRNPDKSDELQIVVSVGVPGWATGFTVQKS